MTTTPAQIARSFCRVLRAWLTKDELAEAVERNRAETSPGVCHSHDHCDANMAMASAFDEHDIPVFSPEGHITEDTCAEWNAAWELARAAEFDPDRVKD